MVARGKILNLERPRLTEIFSILVHQFKTPVSVIRGYLEALLAGDRGKITSGQEEYLKDALENVKRVSRFVDELFDASSIEEKKFELRSKPVALKKVTAEILNNLSHWFKANNCQVFFEKPKKIAKVLTDPLRINEVIQDLIANAVIYKEGRGKVEITLEQKGEQVLFSCKDNGIGIAKEDFKKVFSKFYRSERALNIYPSGTGLGLFISKAIIELSGGKIWFEKNKNRGMTFYFSLPIAK